MSDRLEVGGHPTAATLTAASSIASSSSSVVFEGRLQHSFPAFIATKS